MKRRIEISTIRGITFSNCSEEFVMHGADVEYDYYFLSPRKMLIIEEISKKFKKDTGKDLIIAEAPLKVLKSYVTTKNDKKADKNFSRMPTTGLFSVTKEKKSEITPKKSDTQSADFKDFSILKVIGRGSFSKICLVEHTSTKKKYAMKLLRKDVMLEADQIENTLSEMHVMETVSHPFLIDMQYCFHNRERVLFVIPFLR